MSVEDVRSTSFTSEGYGTEILEKPDYTDKEVHIYFYSWLVYQQFPRFMLTSHSKLIVNVTSD
uniref:Transposase n=1 Tax=Heterorhabditis bacteriophora TaxID=37862 RepID=A0A1I7W6N5_HETBA